MHTRWLRKSSYEILERFHHLENFKAHKRTLPDLTRVLALFEHLDNVFKNCLSDINLPEITTFLNSWNHYRTIASKNLSTNSKSVLKTSHLANLEKSHTRLFKRLKKESYDITPLCDKGELSKAIYLAIAIWG